MWVYRAKSGKTKDGRVWFFKIRYQDIDDRNAQYKSGKFATKKEAEDTELEFRLKIHRPENMDKITLNEMMITLLLVMLFLLQVILLHQEKIIIVNWLMYIKLGSMISDTPVYLYLLIIKLI